MLSAFTDDKERDQSFKADASDEGCLNLHLLITQMESVRSPYDEDGLGTDPAIYLQLYLTGQGGQKIIEGVKKNLLKMKQGSYITFIKKWLLDFLSRLQNSC